MTNLSLIYLLKNNLPAVTGQVIPLVSGKLVIGHLRVVSMASLKNKKELASLAKWRKQAARWFPTVFRVTLAGTRRWGKTLIASPGRILFIIEDLQMVRIGHIGLDKIDPVNRTAEIDNVVRGRGSLPGIMSVALKQLEDWAGQNLGVNRFTLRVFADNRRAVNFYQKSGYAEVGRTGLEYVRNKSGGEWRPATSLSGKSKRAFIRMEKVLNRISFARPGLAKLK